VAENTVGASHGVPEIAVDTLAAWLTSERPPLLLDVRSVDEQSVGMISGAVSMPLPTLHEHIHAIADRPRRPVVIYCAGGLRSTTAAQQLIRFGIADVHSLRGGFDEWQRRALAFIVPTGSGALSPLLTAQHDRYARQLRLPEIGAGGQARLLQARVLCVGAGGLGSAASVYLAAAGVGALGLVDDDRVALSNLNRQIVHDTQRIGMPKVHSAAGMLEALNPDCRVEPWETRLTQRNAAEIIERYDLIVDGSDNLATRYLVNDIAMTLRKPVIYGAVLRFEGQVSVFAGQPCYRCLFPQAPPAELAPSCEEAGVLGVVPGLVGILQATEAIKWILGIGESLAGRLLTIDAMSMQITTLTLAADPHCSSCAK
jgi:molybdopterin/thiamine biosynthesis adenylyltransferase/rhodanese-related sulfurtransferase